MFKRYVMCSWCVLVVYIVRIVVMGFVTTSMEHGRFMYWLPKSSHTAMLVWFLLMLAW